MKKLICSECKLMQPEYSNGGRNIFYCYHPESRTECLPHRIISRSRDREIPTKTAPKWCPLKKEAQNWNIPKHKLTVLEDKR